MYATNSAQKHNTLVDLGHHLPNANIEQIVSLAAGRGQAGRFPFQRFEVRRTNDLDRGPALTLTSSFWIFNELVEGMDAGT